MIQTSRPANPAQLKITDSFWSRYIELIKKEVIPYQWEALNDRVAGAEPSYCIHNFRIAAGLETGSHGGYVFQDSDLFKWIEAAAYVLMWSADPKLEKTVDETIDLICAAQQDDGYINTYYTITGIEKRWTNLMNNHELYCLGHLIEAACAYYTATGKDKLLSAVRRYIDLVDKTFGPEAGKLHGYPGHEIIELALVRLYDITGDENHLKLAQYFIDERGQEPLYFRSECEKYGNDCHWTRGPHGFHYYQAALPVREQESARGHAVRAVYLYAGMADVAGKTGDRELLGACKRLWRSITAAQMYITGSIGSSEYGEAFSFEYDLPNDTVYGETCAAIGLVFFARRMLEIETDVQYSDVMERALYNGIISGMSLDGKSFFYVNPLEALPEASRKDYHKSHVKISRQKWFGCACCPPNLARLLASLGSYAFTTGSDGALFTHLYLGGHFYHQVHDCKIDVFTDTNYPWDGDIRITISPDTPVVFTYALRIPGWCSSYQVKLNGSEVNQEPQKGYVYLSREWRAGDSILIHLDMPVVVNSAHPMVRENIGKAALSRGPLVYCLEEADNGKDLHLLFLEEQPDFNLRYEKDLLGGITVITSDALMLQKDWPDDLLYRPAASPNYTARSLTWIPYYAWANRGEGEMAVWIHKENRSS
jgi:DUF1680 family protein